MIRVQRKVRKESQLPLARPALRDIDTRVCASRGSVAVLPGPRFLLQLQPTPDASSVLTLETYSE